MKNLTHNQIENLKQQWEHTIDNRNENPLAQHKFKQAMRDALKLAGKSLSEVIRHFPLYWRTGHIKTPNNGWWYSGGNTKWEIESYLSEYLPRFTTQSERDAHVKLATYIIELYTLYKEEKTEPETSMFADRLDQYKKDQRAWMFDATDYRNQDSTFEVRISKKLTNTIDSYIDESWDNDYYAKSYGYGRKVRRRIFEVPYLPFYRRGAWDRNLIVVNGLATAIVSERQIDAVDGYYVVTVKASWYIQARGYNYTTTDGYIAYVPFVGGCIAVHSEESRDDAKKQLIHKVTKKLGRKQGYAQFC